MEEEKDRLAFWKTKWEQNEIGFHRSEVHHLMKKHFHKFTSSGEPPHKIFVPLCGKTVDMKWFSEKAVAETVGLDGVHSALEQFYTENGQQWEESPELRLGDTGSRLKSKSCGFTLFCGDILNFSENICGKFDAIWDRGSLVALNRCDIQRYANIMKEILQPGGRILLEVVEYDVKIMQDLDRPADKRPPPPHPMTEQEIKDLYGDTCSIEFLERDAAKVAGKDITMALYLLTKHQ